MKTGDGVLVCGEFREDTIQGAVISGLVSREAIGLEGGAWLDAPDYMPAGSTYREEAWRGNVGTATAQLTVANRT
jgi:hypothetical protein